MARSRENLSLHDAAEVLLEECRTILPGIQALFGFQLIAVFSPGFDEKLAFAEQVFHLAAMVLVAVAVTLIMTPAAYHRQTGPMKVDAAFIWVASHAVLWAMVALMLGLTLEFYIVAKVILAQPVWATIIAAFIFGLIFFLWFKFQRVRALQKFVGAEGTIRTKS
jgi:hypothetical protein